MKNKPDLGFWKLWNLSFGFFGVQIAYALQSANVSRIFATIGADPHQLSYFWILPPLMGLLVQPVVGTLSDKTWTRFGRRLPYLIIGAVVAVIVMCLLPNAGSFGLTISSAIIVGLIALMMLDTSINMAMQPFKMLVGDMVNEKQKGLAYSIQSFLCNAGSVVGFVFPYLLTWFGIQSVAPDGVVPDSVIYSFYIGAIILMFCVIYSLVKIKEWPPKLYAEYNGISEEKKEKTNLIKLLANAPKTFWTVGLVQFFCWVAFLFMWTYTPGTIAMTAFDTPSVEKIESLTDGRNVYAGKYILIRDTVKIVDNGRPMIEGVQIGDRFYPAAFISIDGDTLVYNHEAFLKNGKAGFEINKALANPGKVINIDGVEVAVNGSVQIRDYLSGLANNEAVKLTVAGIVARDKTTGKIVVEEANHFNVENPANIKYITKTDLNTASKEYNAAGDWVGILFGVQAIGSVLWALVLPRLGSRRFSYFLSLLIGGVGFILVPFITNQYLLFIPFVMIGCAWAAMLAWPFTILTNSLHGGNIGAYLGLFNCSICLPQIFGALAGGWILSMFAPVNGLAPQFMMMVVAGISLCIGSLVVWIIKETSGSANR